MHVGCGYILEYFHLIDLTFEIHFEEIESINVYKKGINEMILY